MNDVERQSLQQRLGAMLNADVVAVLSRPGPDFDPAPLLPSHIEFMVALEKRGLLFLSGPLTGRDGRFGQFGLTVLRVASIAEAEEIWADEPFNRAGLRDAEYFVWRMMEGRLSISLDLSDRSFALSPHGEAINV